jgi:FkbM family methyltransferase
VKNVRGIWLPDHEEHLLKFATEQNWTYQKSKLDMAMPFCKGRKLAIDIGGHCGLWSMHLAKLFDAVVAFEPVADHRACYAENVKADNVTLHPVGLGDQFAMASMKTTDGSSGDSYIVPGEDFEVHTLDSYELAPDFIKIDTEGFEYFIIRGGEQTIRTHKPAIIVEQKPGKASEHFKIGDTDAVMLLGKWGYRLRKAYSGDYIMTCSTS